MYPISIHPLYIPTMKHKITISGSDLLVFFNITSKYLFQVTKWCLHYYHTSFLYCIYCKLICLHQLCYELCYIVKLCHPKAPQPFTKKRITSFLWLLDLQPMLSSKSFHLQLHTLHQGCTSERNI